MRPKGAVLYCWTVISTKSLRPPQQSAEKGCYVTVLVFPVSQHLSQRKNYNFAKCSAQLS